MTADELIEILKEDGHITNEQADILSNAVHNRPENRATFLLKAKESETDAITRIIKGEAAGCVYTNHLDTIEIKAVAPVKRGQWNEIREPFGWDDIMSAQCSNCGESYPYPVDTGYDDIVEMFKYCPECGAKMEAGTRWKEEEEEEE